MLTQIFKAMLLTSCVGGVLAIILALVKPITRKCFSASWNYYVLLAVLLVMMLPVRFEFLSASTYISQGAEIPQQASVKNGDIATSDTSNMNNALQTVKIEVTSKITLFSYIWIVGVGISLCIKLISYMVFWRKMCSSSKIYECPAWKELLGAKIAIRICEDMCSPMIAGLFSPTLFLPNITMKDEQMQHILIHERVHLKRSDVLYKWAAMIVKCIHWFNPVIYFVARQINYECEISCDIAVTSKMSKQEATSYINTILLLLSKTRAQHIPCAAAMARDKKQLIRRFTMIQKRARFGKIRTVISVIIAASLLTTTVFASGVFANSAGVYEDYSIAKSGEKVQFTYRPFIEDGTLYLPLRETLGKFINLSDGVSTVLWEEKNKGEITLQLFDREHTGLKENGDIVYTNLYYYRLRIGQPYIYGANKITDMFNVAPVLKGGVTYVPLEIIENIKATSGLLNEFSSSGYLEKQPSRENSRMTISDVVLLSNKAKVDGVLASDYIRFMIETDGSVDNKILKRFRISAEYYLELTGDATSGLKAWLHNEQRGNAINIEAVYYKGEPWWGE